MGVNVPTFVERSNWTGRVVSLLHLHSAFKNGRKGIKSAKHFWSSIANLDQLKSV